ncbi:cysteine--tRNA ligase [Egibacter rhizosphaerae]|uniref:Cysteine--tRNA ligase n=1 Tax=Egibacter rhizosphaerae TaxID=1670831 RepID=A0A411YDN0_9ACTN|nr:cysteine--tRNA ligase [Egibacter rhizosphaerae]QBI19257.1 cysteine--tRNA ligase [Egibacter rhizosphaerae]
MRLHNTLTGTVEPLRPRAEGQLGLYVCGPTVQGPPHFGHARAVIVPDALRRFLEWRGVDVFHVRNVTDVDDKIIDRARAEGRHPAEVAETFTRVWDAQIQALNTLSPHVAPRATGHIPEMIQLIEALLERDAAYVAPPADDAGAGRDVFFRVAAFPAYGKLSGRKPEELRAGVRVEHGEAKEDPVDFVLWKAAKPGEPSWPSPWGAGRPGWHIECSAMATKYLGSDFDIHAGGVDLVFPHHENEIAQYEAATGEPFARHWLHNGHLTLGDDKMSKSEGNIIALDEAIERYGADTLRMFYLQSSYRAPVDFGEDRLREAAAAVERLAGFLRATAHVDAEPDPGLVTDARGQFDEALADDLATPRAHAGLFDLVTRGYEALETGEERLVAGARTAVGELSGVLGYTFEDGGEQSDLVGPLVEELLALREDARARRDFDAADRIRARLNGLGISVEDTPQGARWHRVRV